MHAAAPRQRRHLLLLAGAVTCGIVLSVWGSFLSEDRLNAVAKVGGVLIRLLTVIVLAGEGVRLLRRRSRRQRRLEERAGAHGNQDVDR